MTIEQPSNAVPAEQTIESVATKRPFEEIQSRAMTIHDIVSEDEAQDPDYLEDVEEEQEQEEPVPADANAQESESEDEELAAEQEEEVSVEELTEIVKDAGFQVEVADLQSRILRTGKKIAIPTERDAATDVAVSEE